MRPLLLPDPADPGHLARLDLTAGGPASLDDRALAEAIPLRHTHRDAFEPRALPPELLERLRLAAEEHGVALVPISGDDMVELEVLLSWADEIEEADPDYRAEVAASLRAGPSPDGIPTSALADDPERGSSLRLRDFALVGTRPTNDDPPLAEKPDVVLVVTDHDGPLSWLRAGQALGAVLLHAATPLAQPRHHAARSTRCCRRQSPASTVPDRRPGAWRPDTPEDVRRLTRLQLPGPRPD